MPNEERHAFTAMALALTSMAHSFAVIAANTTGITPDQKARIEAVTQEMKVHGDALKVAVEANKL